VSNSFKQMVKEGTIKRADAMKVALADLHVEPGFNERTEGPELEASIDALAAYILGGGIVPPLEVRAREDGGVWIIDGHRRHRAYGKAVAAGAPIEWIEVRAFAGNDVDRVARIVSSNSGVPLTPLETSRVYRKLAAFGLGSVEIAAKVGKTRAHVDQLLLLASANSDVQTLIAAGTVSAAVAVEAVRKHGEQAGAYLAGQAGKAKAEGKGKVTAGTITGKALPRAVVTGLLAGVDAFTETLTVAAHQVLQTLNLSEPRTVEVDAGALLALLECQREVDEARETMSQKARDKAAKAAQLALPA